MCRRSSPARHPQPVRHRASRESMGSDSFEVGCERINHPLEGLLSIKTGLRSGPQRVGTPDLRQRSHAPTETIGLEDAPDRASGRSAGISNRAASTTPAQDQARCASPTIRDGGSGVSLRSGNRQRPAPGRRDRNASVGSACCQRPHRSHSSAAPSRSDHRQPRGVLASQSGPLGRSCVAPGEVPVQLALRPPSRLRPVQAAPRRPRGSFRFSQVDPQVPVCRGSATGTSSGPVGPFPPAHPEPIMDIMSVCS